MILGAAQNTTILHLRVYMCVTAGRLRRAMEGRLMLTLLRPLPCALVLRLPPEVPPNVGGDAARGLVGLRYFVAQPFLSRR